MSASRSRFAALAAAAVAIVATARPSAAALLVDAAPVTAEAVEAAERCAALASGPEAPWAARHLYRLAALRDWLPPGTAEGCVDRLADRGTAPAEMADLARSLRATWAMEAGDADRARAEAAAAGAVGGWEIAGPFGDPDSALSGGSLEPALASAAEGADGPFEGVSEPVSFAPLPAPRPDGAVDVGRALSGRPGTCAILRASIDPPGGRTRLLRVGGAAAMSVVAGGGEILALEAVRGPAILRAAVPVRGTGSPIRLLVAVCPGGGSGVVRVLLDDAPASGRGPPSDVDEALAALAAGPSTRGGTDSASVRLDAAELVVEAGAIPLGADPIAGALAAVPVEEAARAFLLASRSAATGPERWAAAARAAALDPDDPEPLLRLAEEGASLPGEPGVEEALAAAAESRPAPLRAVVARARRLHASGLSLTALSALAGVAGDPAAPPAVLDAVGGIAGAAGLNDRATEAAERLLAARPLDAAAWSALLDLEIARGDYDAVRERVSDGPPASATWSLDLERLAVSALLRIGAVDEAIVRLSRLAEELPHDAGIRSDLGWALARAGRDEDATVELAAAVVAGASDQGARDWIAARGDPGVDPDDALASWDEIEADARPILDAPGAAGPAYVFRGTLVSMGAGSGARQHERRALAVRPGAAPPDRLALASYDPSRTLFRLGRGFVRRADGTVAGNEGLEASGADSPDARLFTARRIVSLRLPALRPGDLVEVEFDLVDLAAAPLPEGSLARELPIREVYPTSRLRVAAVVPEGTEITADVPPGVLVDFSERPGPGDRVTRTWDSRDVPGVPREPFGPPLREAAGMFRLTTFRTWAEVAGWIGPLFRAGSLSRSVATEAAGKDVAAIYRTVAAGVRYVAAEYGSHGLRPLPPALTLARGYGDCKDKAALLSAMLAEAGVDSRIVLLRTRLSGADPSGGAFAYPYAFDHVIVYLPPPIDRYVDATATSLPWDVLPRTDRGATGLVLDPAGGPPELVTLPEDPPEGEGIDRRHQLFFDTTGDAALVGETFAAGADAGDLRNVLTAPDTRAGMMSVLLDRDLPDIRVVGVDAVGLDPDAPETRVTYIGSVPAWAGTTADGMVVPTGARPDLLRRFASLDRRTTDLELSTAGFPSALRYDVQASPTGGWSWEDVPRDARESGPFGSFSVLFRVEGTTLRVSVAISLPRLRIRAGEYAEFRAFLGRIDDALAGTASAVRRMP